MNKAFEKILDRLEATRYIAQDDSVAELIRTRIWNKALHKVKQIVKEVAEEYKDGWIACGERLPDNDKKQYIVQKTNGFIDILGFTKDAYKLSRYDFVEYKGKKKQLFYEYDSEYGYIELECEAWQPLPEPFKERD